MICVFALTAFAQEPEQIDLGPYGGTIVIGSNKKQTEYFFAIKELEVTELKIKSCINLQELEQLLIQKNNLVETINFHIRIPSSLKYSWEEILTYIDNIENFGKKYYYL